MLCWLQQLKTLPKTNPVTVKNIRRASMLKKKMSPILIMFILMAVGIAGAFFGVLAELMKKDEIYF